MDSLQFPSLRLECESDRGPCSKATAGVLGVFLGAFGVHRFYLGYRWTALLQCGLTLVSLGLAGFWGTWEGLMILMGRLRQDAMGRPLRSTRLAHVPARCPRVAVMHYRHSRNSPWFLTVMLFFFPLTNSLVLAAIWTLAGWSLPGVLGTIPELIPPPGGEHWVHSESVMTLTVEMISTEDDHQQEVATFQLADATSNSMAPGPLESMEGPRTGRSARLVHAPAKSAHEPRLVAVAPTMNMSASALGRSELSRSSRPELPRVAESSQDLHDAQQRISERPQVRPSALAQQVARPPVDGGSEANPGVVPRPLVQPVYNPSPEYPSLALEKGHEGLVKILARIAANGTVHEARVHRSSGHAALDASALKVVQQWRFKVTAKEPVMGTVEVLVPVRFQIESTSE